GASPSGEWLSRQQALSPGQLYFGRSCRRSCPWRVPHIEAHVWYATTGYKHTGRASGDKRLHHHGLWISGLIQRNKLLAAISLRGRMTWAAVGVKGWLVTGRHLSPITATRHNPERDRLLRKQGSDVIVQCFGGDSLALVSLILTVMMRSKPHLSIAAAGG